MKRKGKETEEKMAELKRRLAEVEKGRKEAEERLAKAGCNTGADNYLKVLYKHLWCLLFM
jgi:ribosome-interacting GTPase 1